MPTYNLQRFSNPDALKAVSIDCLLRFLSPHIGFFKMRGLDLDESSGEEEDFDYPALVDILMTPDEDTPKELVDALYYVHEMATLEGMDFLLTEAEKRGISLAVENPTPIDVAMRMWTLGGEIVECAHAKESMARQRTFVYFQTDKKCGMSRDELNMDSIGALQDDLDDYFMRRQRGRGSRVFVFDRFDEVWFLVRHGEPFKREGILDDGKSSSVFYRPERYDVVVYNPRLGDLRIHAATKGEVELYKTLFGRHLFGEDRYFPSKDKYTLEPLRSDGEASLVCSDIPGIECITLCELEFEQCGFRRNVVRWKSEDVFGMLNATDEEIPPWARLSKAVFKVLFSGCMRPRTVSIKTSNIAQFQRDDDGRLIDLWLELRGFVVSIGKASDEDETPEELMVAVICAAKMYTLLVYAANVDLYFISYSCGLI